MKPGELITKYNIKRFYHFTDRRNLPSIREHGLLSWSELQRLGITPEAPGGNDWSHEADERNGLDGLVHLCFIDEHPMEYVARKEGRLGQTVFLQISPLVLEIDGVIFSPDVANKSGVAVLKLAEAVDVLDLDVVYRRLDWKNHDINQRRQAAKKYELLVPERVPVELITNL